MTLDGSLNHDGYKRIRDPDTEDRIFAHRYSWEALNGTVPEGKELHHLCKNRACYNPDHLQLIGISDHKALSNRERAGTGYYTAHLRKIYDQEE